MVVNPSVYKIVGHTGIPRKTDGNSGAGMLVWGAGGRKFFPVRGGGRGWGGVGAASSRAGRWWRWRWSRSAAVVQAGGVVEVGERFGVSVRLAGAAAVSRAGRGGVGGVVQVREPSWEGFGWRGVVEVRGGRRNKKAPLSQGLRGAAALGGSQATSSATRSAVAFDPWRSI